jgi:UDP-glucose 4-epimerase
VGERNVAIHELGIRPGEKMHEVLVSEEEIHHCVRRGNFYAVRSMLPELADEKKPNELTREFSSADTVLDLAGTAELLRQHRLMVDDPLVYDDGELLR